MADDLILGFTWDENNTEKLAAHELTTEDVEGVFDGKPIIFQHPKHHARYLALGFVPQPDDRFVLVSFEMDHETRWVRVVTAFEPTHEKWWRIYAKAKNITP